MGSNTFQQHNYQTMKPSNYPVFVWKKNKKSPRFNNSFSPIRAIRRISVIREKNPPLTMNHSPFLILKSKIVNTCTARKCRCRKSKIPLHPPFTNCLDRIEPQLNRGSIPSGEATSSRYRPLQRHESLEPYLPAPFLSKALPGTASFLRVLSASSPRPSAFPVLSGAAKRRSRSVRVPFNINQIPSSIENRQHLHRTQVQVSKIENLSPSPRDKIVSCCHH
jgi:hypothetical protein